MKIKKDVVKRTKYYDANNGEIIHEDSEGTTEEILLGYKCDICGMECTEESQGMNYDLELQEFHHIGFYGGYSSVFGDCNHITCDICQKCLHKMIIRFCSVNGKYPKGNV